MTRAATGRGTRRRYQEPQLRVHRWTIGEPRVVIVHEMRIVGPALRHALDGRAQVLSQTVFGSAAVALCNLLAPDVVVAGDLLPDGIIEQFIPGLLQSGPRILLLTDFHDDAHARQLLRLGVSGVVSMEASLDAAAAAILSLSRGEAVIPPALTESLLREWRGTGPISVDTPVATLTDRERDVLAAIADGMGTKAIARRLGIALKTAEHHKTHVFQKLGVRTQAEAVTLARQAKWLSAAGSPALPDADAPGRELA